MFVFHKVYHWNNIPAIERNLNCDEFKKKQKQNLQLIYIWSVLPAF